MWESFQEAAQHLLPSSKPAPLGSPSTNTGMASANRR